MCYSLLISVTSRIVTRGEEYYNCTASSSTVAHLRVVDGAQVKVSTGESWLHAHRQLVALGRGKGTGEIDRQIDR